MPDCLGRLRLADQVLGLPAPVFEAFARLWPHGAYSDDELIGDAYRLANVHRAIVEIDRRDEAGGPA